MDNLPIMLLLTNPFVSMFIDVIFTAEEKLKGGNKKLKKN